MCAASASGAPWMGCLFVNGTDTDSSDSVSLRSRGEGEEEERLNNFRTIDKPLKFGTLHAHHCRFSCHLKRNDIQLSLMRLKSWLSDFKPWSFFCLLGVIKKLAASRVLLICFLPCLILAFMSGAMGRQSWKFVDGPVRMNWWNIPQRIQPKKFETVVWIRNDTISRLNRSDDLSQGLIHSDLFVPQAAASIVGMISIQNRIV